MHQSINCGSGVNRDEHIESVVFLNKVYQLCHVLDVLGLLKDFLFVVKASCAQSALPISICASL